MASASVGHGCWYPFWNRKQKTKFPLQFLATTTIDETSEPTVAPQLCFKAPMTSFTQ